MKDRLMRSFCVKKSNLVMITDKMVNWNSLEEVSKEVICPVSNIRKIVVNKDESVVLYVSEGNSSPIITISLKEISKHEYDSLISAVCKYLKIDVPAAEYTIQKG